MNWDSIFIEVVTPDGVGLVSLSSVMPIVLEVGTPGLPGATTNPLDFMQNTAQATWIINHNFGYNPMIQVFNTGGGQIEAEVIHTSINQTRVYFVTPTAGYARLI